MRVCVCVFFLNGYSLKGYFRVICPLIITPLITIITLLITYRYWASGRWSQNRLVKSSGSSRPRSYYNGQPSPPQSLVRVIRDTRVIISFTRVYTYIYIYIYINGLIWIRICITHMYTIRCTREQWGRKEQPSECVTKRSLSYAHLKLTLLYVSISLSLFLALSLYLSLHRPL